MRESEATKIVCEAIASKQIIQLRYISELLELEPHVLYSDENSQKIILGGYSIEGNSKIKRDLDIRLVTSVKRTNRNFEIDSATPKILPEISFEIICIVDS